MSEIDDKKAEHERYDVRAHEILNSVRIEELPALGSQYFPEHLRAPYEYFESLLKKQLNSDHKVLEIGAGSGQHTEALIKSGASVIATDISDNSLKVLQKRIKHQLNVDVTIKSADMEKLPFEDKSFNCVVSAGSLSYGDNDIVLNEIYRVLKLGGNFICVDSLNHNPVYALNRWIHFLRGSRTKNTLQRIPSLTLLKKYEKKFGSCEAKFFGAITWASPILIIFGNRFARTFIEGFDKIFKIKKSAFKFVMCVKKEKLDI